MMNGNSGREETESRISEESRLRNREIYMVTIVGSIANFVLLLFKFVAGIVGHSAAMLADAVHSLSDFVTDIIVIVFVGISNKPQDKDHDYGHGKYETVATVIIGEILLLVGLKIFKDSAVSIWNFFHGVLVPKPGMIALVATFVSIIVKEILYRYTIKKGRKLDSGAVVANAWHHRSDALSSVGAAVGIGGAIVMGERWGVLDPIAALAVSVFIVKVAVELLIPGFNELVEVSLSESAEREIEDVILSFPEVSDPHNMRTRRIGNYCAIDVHVRMDKSMPLEKVHAITDAIEHDLRQKLGERTYINIHVEPRKDM